MWGGERPPDFTKTKTRMFEPQFEEWAWNQKGNCDCLRKKLDKTCSAFSRLNKSVNMLLLATFFYDIVLTAHLLTDPGWVIFLTLAVQIHGCSPSLMLTLLFNGKSTSEQLWPENLTHFQDFSMERRSWPCHHLMLCNATANSCLSPTGPRSDSHKASVLHHGATACPNLTDYF